MTTTVEVINSVAQGVTAIGVVIAGIQLWLAKRIASSQFEDQFSTQYREILQRIPVKALLGDQLTEAEFEAALPSFYHYLDLCNEQVFLHDKGRISSATWIEWKSGIKQNLARPAFTKAWAIISKRAPDSFDELRRIVPPPLLR